MARRFSIDAVFRAVDRITGPVNRMSQSVQGLTNRVNRFTKSTNRAFGGAISKVKSFGTIAAGVLAAPTAAFVSMVKTGAEFEQMMVNAGVRFGESTRKGTKGFEELQEVAAYAGATTEFTATNAAEALNQMATSGFTAKQAMAGLNNVIDLATASGEDLGSVTTMATDALGAFGLKTDDAMQQRKNFARVSDVMVKAATTSSMTVGQFYETLKQGGPIAKTAGASIETFAAMTGTLANAGLKASRAGTTLKNMFVVLSGAGSKEAKEGLAVLGVKTRTKEGDLRDPIKLIGDLNRALDGLGTADRSAMLEKIFGRIPLAGVNVLLEAGEERLRKYKETLDGAGGSARNMADDMRNTVSGALAGLRSAVESVSIAFFNLNNTSLQKTIEKITEWIRLKKDILALKFSEFVNYLANNIKELGQTAQDVIKVASAFFILVTAVNALNFAMTVTSGLFWAVSTVMTSWPAIIKAVQGAIYGFRVAMVALNISVWAFPGTWLLAVIAALVAAVGLIYYYWEPLSEFFSGLWEGIVKAFKWGWDTAGTIIGYVMEGLSLIPGLISKTDVAAAKAMLTVKDIQDYEFTGPRALPSQLENQYAGATESGPSDVFISPIPPLSSVQTSEVTLVLPPGYDVDKDRSELPRGLTIQPSGGM